MRRGRFCTVASSENTFLGGNDMHKELNCKRFIGKSRCVKKVIGGLCPGSDRDAEIFGCISKYSTEEEVKKMRELFYLACMHTAA